MDTKKQKLIIEGNSLYEIDLECMNKKRGSGDITRNPNSGLNNTLPIKKKNPGN